MMQKNLFLTTLATIVALITVTSGNATSADIIPTSATKRDLLATSYTKLCSDAFGAGLLSRLNHLDPVVVREKVTAFTNTRDYTAPNI